MKSIVVVSAESSVSSTVGDPSREIPRSRFDSGRKLLQHYRAYQRCLLFPGPLKMLRYYHSVMHKIWSAVSGVDMPLNSKIEVGLLMPHPNGIVIHPDAKIGPNCLLFQQVTIGTGGPIPGVPTLEGHVDVGAGAKLLGGIHVGAHAKIGANAVVLIDVPSGATAVGVPARVLSKNVSS